MPDETLGRFNHHPDPAIDFEIEVQSLQARLFDAKGGISKPGTEPEHVGVVFNDIMRAMLFTVGGDPSAVAAKQVLRALETEAREALRQRSRSAEDPTDQAVLDLCAHAYAEAQRAMRKFPQPNYVISKVAEEAGEVVKAAIHCAEGRDTPEHVIEEIRQAMAMLIRLYVEGDQVHGLPPLLKGTTNG